MKRAITAILLLTLLIPCAMAQDSGANREMEHFVYKVKFADLNDVHSILQAMMSPYGRDRIAEDSKTVVVNDFPENITRIREALEAMDVRPHSIMLTVYLFWAQKESSASLPAEGTNEEIRGAIEEVASLMPYNAFTPLGEGAIQLSAKSRNGQLKVGDNVQIQFNSDYTQESRFLVLENFSIVMPRASDGANNLVFQTDVTITDGEITVAGITRPNGTNKAIVSIIKMQVID